MQNWFYIYHTVNKWLVTSHIIMICTFNFIQYFMNNRCIIHDAIHEQSHEDFWWANTDIAIMITKLFKVTVNEIQSPRYYTCQQTIAQVIPNTQTTIRPIMAWINHNICCWFTLNAIQKTKCEMTYTGLRNSNYNWLSH